MDRIRADLFSGKDGAAAEQRKHRPAHLQSLFPGENDQHLNE
jgi:hypothetical protein